LVQKTKKIAMKILSRYLISQFLSVLIFSIIAFALVFVIVDLIENLDHFIDREVPKLIIAIYYFYYLPYIIILVLPIAMLLASLFSVGNLSRFNELTAMKASGISLYRIAIPLWGLGLIISLFALVFGEFVVPVASQKKFDIKRLYVDRIPRRAYTRRTNIIFLEGENRRISISYFDGSRNIAHKVSIQNFTNGRMIKRIDAKTMIWGGNGWTLQNGVVRRFTSPEEMVEPFTRLSGLKFSFRPLDLQKLQKKPDEMDYFELRNFIDKISKVGADPQKWLVDLQLKIAFPFTNLIIILFGLPLAASHRHSGPALGFVISLIICFLFFGLIRTLQAMGHNGVLPPFWAAWSSNLLFATLGTILMIKAKK